MTRQWPNGSTSISTVTAEFGGDHPLTGYHRGIDLIGFTWNRAADDGVVILAGENGTAGFEVRILHDDGYRTRYLHNEKGSLQVRVGQRVARGDALGHLGDTGYVTGPHLHFEVIAPDGATRINPRDYIAAGAPAGGDSRPFPLPTPATHYLEDTMSKPAFYAKGDKAPDVYAVYTDACDTNNVSQGGAYCARRYVYPGELAGVEAKGEKVVTLKQDDLDLLPKIAGSR